MKENIGVLGGGSWGSALAILLSKKGYNVDMWMRNSEQVDEIKKTHYNKRYLKDIVFPDSIGVIQKNG